MLKRFFNIMNQQIKNEIDWHNYILLIYTITTTTNWVNNIYPETLPSVTITMNNNNNNEL